MESNKTRQYFTGLDGLRAIAVIFVILFHLQPNVFSGGFIGVPIFFVISGFLMTDSILAEISSTAKFNISQFYLKRLKRLFPALVVMIAVVATFLLVFYKQGLYGIRDVVWTNVTYTNNWWQIFNQTNYFEQANNWAPFTHLWSLSVEAQFYFIWPIILTVLIFSTRDRAFNALKISVILSIVSMILFSVLYTPTDLNRSYYGTDTRFYAFLFGAIISILSRIDIFNPKNKIVNRTLTLLYKFRGIIAVGSLAVVFVGFALLNGHQDWTYLWGTHLVTLAAAISVASVVFDRRSFFSAALSNRVFEYLGQRSYSIYLYQLPVMVIMEHFLKNIISQKVLLAGLEIAAILLISELSYRFVEATRYGRWKSLSDVFDFFKNPTLSQMIKTSVATFAITLLSIGTISAMSTREAVYSADSDKLEKELNQKQKEIDSKNEEADFKVRHDFVVTDEDVELANFNKIKPQSLAELKTKTYTAVGDSVMLDIAPTLQNALPSTYVDAQVGEQVADGIYTLDSIKQSGQLGDIVIVVLGMNGAINDGQIEQMMSVADKKDVYWINNRAEGRPWIEPNNSVLKQESRNYKNLHVVDWYAASNSHPDWFADDGTHPMDIGINELVSIILQSMEKYSVKFNA